MVFFAIHYLMAIDISEYWSPDIKLVCMSIYPDEKDTMHIPRHVTQK